MKARIVERPIGGLVRASNVGSAGAQIDEIGERAETSARIHGFLEKTQRFFRRGDGAVEEADSRFEHRLVHRLRGGSDLVAALFVGSDGGGEVTPRVGDLRVGRQ